MGVQIILAEMNTGETGTVIEVLGGKGVNYRLSSMGIRPKAKVTKVSKPFGRGLVLLQVGRAQIALGFGMSHKIIIEVER